MSLQTDFYAEEGTGSTVTVQTSETDPFEPNEVRENATEISPSQAGTISIGDHDWFAFTAQKGEPINVSLTAESDGKINVKLHSTEKQLAGVDVSDGSNNLSAVANATGTYYLHISKDFYADRGTDYSFEVETAGIAEQTSDGDGERDDTGGVTDATDGGDGGGDLPIVPAAVGLGAVGLLVAFVWRRRDDEES